MHKPFILVVDDEPGIAKFLKVNLTENGFETGIARDGQEALQAVEKRLPDLIILDIMMPNIDGFAVLQRIREWSPVPIIMLSSRSDEAEKVKCLRLGADDYISKPFGINELLARVEAVLRRSRPDRERVTSSLFRSGELVIDFTRRKVSVAGTDIKLTPTEYELLRELALNAGKVLTHTELLRKVWGPEYRDEREYLRVFIAQLRTKLKLAGSDVTYITTVPGVGYRFQDGH
jgi:two-component system KDP operon response regulator KdpE